MTTAVRKEGFLLCCCTLGWHSGQGSRVCNSTTISSVQEPCSTLAGVGHFGHRFSAFWPSFLFVSLQKVLPDVMDTDSEMRLIDVPERSTEDLVITVNTEERKKNASRSRAERAQSEESHMDQRGRFEYPAHLRSEIYWFDGILPPQSLGELSETDRARLHCLNGVPNRPCSARFRLPDNTVDAKTILDHITSTGVMGIMLNVFSVSTHGRLK